jgi:hypothetical protein
MIRLTFRLNDMRQTEQSKGRDQVLQHVGQFSLQPFPGRHFSLDDFRRLMAEGEPYLMKLRRRGIGRCRLYLG